MPYVTVQGRTLEPERRQRLARAVASEVARLFATPLSSVVVVMSSTGEDGLSVVAGERETELALEITVEGAGLGENEVPEVVERVSKVAESPECPLDKIMVLVKVPGGPHMRATARCCGIGGQVLQDW